MRGLAARRRARTNGEKAVGQDEEEPGASGQTLRKEASALGQAAEDDDTVTGTNGKWRGRKQI